MPSLQAMGCSEIRFSLLTATRARHIILFHFLFIFRKNIGGKYMCATGVMFSNSKNMNLGARFIFFFMTHLLHLKQVMFTLLDDNDLTLNCAGSPVCDCVL